MALARLMAAITWSGVMLIWVSSVFFVMLRSSILKVLAGFSDACVLCAQFVGYF